MALQSSGPISLLDIQNEFGGSAPISISEYYGVASGVPGSGSIGFGHFHGKSSAIPFSVSFTQCVDHWGTFVYDGGGNIRMQSREPSGAIHTGRGDCSGYPQGDFTYVSFSTSGKTTVSGTVTWSGRDSSGSWNFSYGVGSSSGQVNLFTDGSGGAAGYSFTISGTVT